MSKPFNNLETPCIGICSTIYGDEVCRGCKRFCDEIIEWNTYDKEQKSSVLKRLESLTVKATSRKLTVENSPQLKKYCAQYQVKVRDEFDPLCWAHTLLREAAEKIKNPKTAGLSIHKDFASLSLREISNLIDEDLYALSEDKCP